METIFSAGNAAAGTGWLAILIALFVVRARGPLFVYSGLILPMACAMVYVGLLIAASAPPRVTPDFSSLAGIKALFSRDVTMNVGWYHFMAFDLVIGTWIARDGLARGARWWLLLPILAITCMVGPMGLLAYGLAWAAWLRRSSPALPMPGPST